MKRFFIVLALLVALFEWNDRFFKVLPDVGSLFLGNTSSIDKMTSSHPILEETSSRNTTNSLVSEADPLKVLLISGHGTLTRDPGATYAGRYEYAYAYDLVQRVADNLAGDSAIEVLLEPSPLIASEEMTLISQTDADLILSIHFNAGKGSGSEMIVPLFVDDLSFPKSLLGAFNTFGQPLRQTAIYSRSTTQKISRNSDGSITGTDYYGVIRAGANRGIASYILEIEFIDNESNMAFYDSHVQDYVTSISNVLKDLAIHR